MQAFTYICILKFILDKYIYKETVYRTIVTYNTMIKLNICAFLSQGRQLWWNMDETKFEVNLYAPSYNS